MPVIDAAQFYKEIDGGKVHPLYFFFGEEPYLLNQSILRFKYQVLDESNWDFNFDQFYAADAKVDTIRDTVQMLPMMSPRRLVILKEAQELTDKEWAELEEVIETPSESTVFVVLASKIDKRKKAMKLLIDHAQAIEFKKPYDNEIPGWIRHIAKGLGLQIAEDAVSLMHRLVGSHLTEIESELLKLKDFCTTGRIEVSDVAQVVSRSKEESIFDFAKAIGEGNRVVALEQLVHLLDQGQSEIGIVSMISRHIRILLLVKRGLEEGLNKSQISQKAQVPPYFLEQYMKQAHHWTISGLENNLVLLSDTDRALKSSPLSSHIWLENMVLKSCVRH